MADHEPEITQIIRDWVADVAYDEDDFVIRFEDGTHTGTPVEVIQLLDSLDPDWRSVFTPPGGGDPA